MSEASIDASTWLQRFAPEALIGAEALLIAEVAHPPGTAPNTAAAMALLRLADSYFDDVGIEQLLTRVWADSESQGGCSLVAAARGGWRSDVEMTLRARWSGLWLCSCNRHAATVAALAATIAHKGGGNTRQVVSAHYLYWRPERA